MQWATDRRLCDLSILPSAGWVPYEAGEPFTPRAGFAILVSEPRRGAQGKQGNAGPAKALKQDKLVQAQTLLSRTQAFPKN